MRRTLFYGTGNLASSILRGWHAAGADLSGIRAYRAAQRIAGIPVATISAAELPGTWDEIWIGVKPQIFPEVSAELREYAGPETRIVSLMAGVTTGQISDVLGGRDVLRVMTNIMTAQRKGASALFCDTRLRDEFEPVRERMESLGPAIWAADEDTFEVATVLIGSAPAFIMEFVLALEEAVCAQGWDRSLVGPLVRGVAQGTLATIPDTAAECQARMNAVTSKGGTTEAGLSALQPALRDLMMLAVAQAVGRGRALGASSSRCQ